MFASFVDPRRLMRAAIVMATIVLCSSAVAAPPDKGLGTNLHGVEYWSPALPFVDVFKQSGDWISQRDGVREWDTGEVVEVGEDGWPRALLPGQQAASVVLHGGRYPIGEYHLSFAGRGVLQPLFDARVAERHGNRMTVNVIPSSMVVLKVLKSDERDPIRNIRFLLPGFDPERAPTFNPAYLAHLDGFKVLRFTNWANTSTTTIEHWSDRTRMDDARQARPAGVAVEHMIELAEAVGAIPWFNVPHAADDTYVREMARLIKARHGATRKFYLEYTSEHWRSGQPAHGWFQREAARRGMKGIDELYVRRALQIFQIFEEVFERRNVVVRVLSGQSSNAGRNQQILNLVDLRGRVDAFAIAPYFATFEDLAGNDQELRAVPIADLIGRAERSLERVRGDVRTAKRMAQQAGIALIAYGGGQHVTQPHDSKGACIVLNRHDAMEDLYSRYLDLWARETDGALMVLFTDMSNFGVNGCWGLKEHHEQKAWQTPKLRAVRDFIQGVVRR